MMAIELDQSLTDPFTLGHAGAIISGGKGGAQDKMAALENANVIVSKSPADMGVLLKKVSFSE